MRYLRTLLRHWALYAIPLLLLPAIMTAYGYYSLRTYKSEALLFFQRPSFLPTVGIGWDSNKTPAQNQADAITELLGSETFMTGIAGRTGLRYVYHLDTQAGRDAAFARLTTDLVVQPTQTGADTLTITAQDSDRWYAQEIVQATITQYTKYYENHRLQADQQAITFFTDQATAEQNLVTQDANHIALYLRGHPEKPAAPLDPELFALQQTQNQDQNTLNHTTDNLKLAHDDYQATNAAGSLVQVLDAPTVPLHSSLVKRKLLLDTGIGFGIALALVALVVVFLTRRDRRVYFTQDLLAIGEELDWDLPTVQHFPILKELFLSPDAKRVIGDGDDASGPYFDGVAPAGV
jgi:hypothetical protein